MHITKSQYWFALAAFGFAASAAQAEWITPDSIPNPPAAVASANGTPAYADNLVWTQYGRFGLEFTTPWNAITHLNGVPVWAPVGMPPYGYSWGKINYYAQWYGAYLYGMKGRMTVSSLTVETIKNSGQLSLWVIGQESNQPLKITPTVQSVPGSNGEEIWNFKGSGIYGVAAILTPPPVAVGSSTSVNPAWGVAAISFDPPPGQVPEPSSLVLAGLGALGLAARFGWRRTRGAMA
jgi:hypothetical protein